MKANKDHISLETAKLLEGCGVESELWFVLFSEDSADTYNSKYENGDWIQNDTIPAYTWGEILWEHAEEFFGIYRDRDCELEENLLHLLQQKQYDQADLYFRKHCILIKKK